MGRPLLRWLPPIIVVATVLYTISQYPTLPPRIPSHWGVSGQPNGWSPRAVGAWLMPAIMVFLWALSVVVPKLDTRKTSSEQFGVVFSVVIAAIMIFQAVVQYAMLSIAQGVAVDMNTVVYVGIGALLAVLGIATASLLSAVR